jgi:hypothetical protein
MADDFVKVPFYVESDGSKTFFLPDCRHKVGYEIGQRGKDKEKYIQTYWEALEKLMKMPKPRFRRRNKNGNSGTVVCNPGDIEEISRMFIEDERVKYGG